MALTGALVVVATVIAAVLVAASVASATTVNLRLCTALLAATVVAAVKCHLDQPAKSQFIAVNVSVSNRTLVATAATVAAQVVTSVVIVLAALTAHASKTRKCSPLLATLVATVAKFLSVLLPASQSSVTLVSVRVAAA